MYLVFLIRALGYCSLPVLLPLLDKILATKYLGGWFVTSLDGIVPLFCRKG